MLQLGRVQQNTFRYSDRKNSSSKDIVKVALTPTDWYVIRKSEVGTVSDEISAYRTVCKRCYGNLKTAINAILI